jgi:hypothetical protein
MTYDPYDIELADWLAGGPRDDLDDVVITEPCEDNYSVTIPGDDVLAGLAALLTETEERWLVKRYYPWDMPEDTSVKNLALATVNRYAADVYTRNPHLRTCDAWEAAREFGYEGTVESFQQYMSKRKLTEKGRGRRLQGRPYFRRSGK